MRSIHLASLLLLLPVTLAGQGGNRTPEQIREDSLTLAIRPIVGRLDLAKYKETIRGLTQFGDRRQGTDRNRAAVDWIEAKLKSYGCTNTERVKYLYSQRQLRNDSTNRVDSIARAASGQPPGIGGERPIQ